MLTGMVCAICFCEMLRAFRHECARVLNRWEYIVFIISILSSEMRINGLSR